MVSYLMELFAWLFSGARLVGNIHREELERIRNTALYLVLIPLVFLIVGVACGAIPTHGWAIKSVALEISLTFAAVFLLLLGWRRALIGFEASVAVAAAGPGDANAATIVNALERYIRIVAALLASEIAIGLVVFWVPVHRSPILTFLAILAAIVLVAHWVWQGGELWWPVFTRRLAITTLILIVLANLFPDTVALAAAKFGSLDAEIVKGIPSLMDGKADFRTIAILLAVPFIMYAAICFFQGYWGRLFAVLVLVLIIGTVYWIVAGEHADAEKARKWFATRATHSVDTTKPVLAPQPALPPLPKPVALLTRDPYGIPQPVCEERLEVGLNNGNAIFLQKKRDGCGAVRFHTGRGAVAEFSASPCLPGTMKIYPPMGPALLWQEYPGMASPYHHPGYAGRFGKINFRAKFRVTGNQNTRDPNLVMWCSS